MSEEPGYNWVRLEPAMEAFSQEIDQYVRMNIQE